MISVDLHTTNPQGPSCDSSSSPKTSHGDNDCPSPNVFKNSSTELVDDSNAMNEGSSEKSHHRNDQTTRPVGTENDEGVEVVLEVNGKSSVMDSTSRPNQDQNVFRAPQPLRPRDVHEGVSRDMTSDEGYVGRQPSSHHHHAAISYPPCVDYMEQPFNHVSNVDSSSFEQQQDTYMLTYIVPQTSHQSPHVQYPPLGGKRSEDLNVISPNHKNGAQRRHPGYGPPHHPPLTSRRNGSRYSSQTATSSYNYYTQASPAGRTSGSGSPPRVRGYVMKRLDGPYSAAQRGRDENTVNSGSWSYATPEGSRPPVVAESSFDSEHPYSSQMSHSSSQPTTPNAPHYYGPYRYSQHNDPPPSYYPRSGYPESFDHGNSFDSNHASYGPSPSSSHHDGGYYDHERSYYGHSPSSQYRSHPSESSYTSYSYGYSPVGSNGGYYDPYSPQSGHYVRPPPRSYDEYDRYHHHYPYHPHSHYHHYHPLKKDEKSGMALPEAASEVNFDISDPPLEPSTPASKQPVCQSPADVNSYDVLCGRGGGTNSQVGNRRFRKLVQEFQPIYLLARRKEKPLLARTIVLIIRKRGGRFLKKDDETGELYEVGDSKAEAKTSQALREGLDVRATKSAASSLLDKNKKKKVNSKQLIPGTTNPTSGIEGKIEPSHVVVTLKHKMSADNSCKEIRFLNGKAVVSPAGALDTSKRFDENISSNNDQALADSRSASPPSLPKLKNSNPKLASFRSDLGNEPIKSASIPDAPPSPEQMQFRKRRRMRSADGGIEPTTGACGVGNPFQGDKLFPDFCPPRADLGRAGNPPPWLKSDDVPHMDMCGMTPIAASSVKFDDDDIRYEDAHGVASGGCAGIALDMMTGAATGSFW